MSKTKQQRIETEEQLSPEAVADQQTDQPLEQVNDSSSDQQPLEEVNDSSKADDSKEDQEKADPLALLQGEVEQLKDTLLRRTAEFENIKKRMLRERMELLEGAKVEALKQFLPVNDDLQRTLQAADGQDIPEGFLQGVSMVAEKFGSILTAAGVEPISEAGVPFDVNLHDALMRQPSPDGKTPSDTVLQVLEIGYKVGNKIIRHAKVIVSE